MALFIFLPIAGMCGASLDRYMNSIFDPRVRDDIRSRWNEELRLHQGQIEEYKREKQQWEKNKDARKRKEQERLEKEKRSREMARLYWHDVNGNAQCSSHGARWYTGQLKNLRFGMDAIAGCEETAVTIHNVTYEHPTHCEHRV